LRGSELGRYCRKTRLFVIAVLNLRIAVLEILFYLLRGRLVVLVEIFYNFQLRKQFNIPARSRH
jgi:hypothetical protein